MPADETSKRETARNLRERKERKRYTDDWTLAEEELEGGRSYRLEEKLESEKYTACFVKEMKGSELTLEHVQRHGFTIPVLIHDKTGLGIKIPSQNFTVNDVRICVGSRRILDVMDTATQRNVEMTLKEWQRYFESTERDRILNVISLEFSRTRLEQYVEAPRIVRQLDWVDRVWPRHLKEQQQEATNLLDDMMYPKVQKYCLMSVGGCYTDFHVDFGGTSVWYHVLRGRKIFWLAPPTEKNLRLYEQWVLSGKQGDAFLGDAFDKCGRVTLVDGDTFFIPTGWIHAVYTPEDSLVFGGNFLHSFGMEKQLRIAQVPQKFRYPFFTEMLWYVLARYVECVLGRNSLKLPDGALESKPKNLNASHIHLTPHELHGLKAIVMYLHALPANKKNVPEIIHDVVGLIRDVRTLVEQHRRDSAEQAITGRPILIWPDEDEFGLSKESSVDRVANRLQKVKASRGTKGNLSTKAARRRRTRCRRCEACLREDCGECAFCRDMVKFGGQGRAKQSCMLRQCLQPMLPITSVCRVCGKDGWGQAAHAQHKPGLKEESSTLMECSVCWEIVHPTCAAIVSGSDAEGIPNEDLPNSWECPQCCREGRNLEAKPRHFRARSKVVSATQEADDAHDATELEKENCDAEASNQLNLSFGQDEISSGKRKLENVNDEANHVKKIKEVDSSDRSSEEPVKCAANLLSCTPGFKKNLGKHHKNQLATKLQSLALPRPLKKSAHLTRPASAHQDDDELDLLLRTNPQERAALNLALEKSVMLHVFRFLTVSELCSAMLVCRAWHRICSDRRLWLHIDLSHRKICPSHMTGVVRRQPERADFSWSSVTRKQLEWLVGRLPHLSHLALQGCSWHVISALRTCNCPLLLSLDLRFMEGLNDTHIRDILSPPLDSRPGLVDSKSRLRNLRDLCLAGCDISDVSLRYIAQHLKLLSRLDISSCYKITDAGIALLAASGSPMQESLTALDLRGCKNISDSGVEHLKNCEALVHLDLQHTPLITYAAVRNLVMNSRHPLQATADKLVELRVT